MRLMIAGLVLAAGAGRRFGGAKQLAELDGRPLLEHALQAVAEAPLDRRVVVLGSQAEDVIARVDLHGAEPLICERWSEGQSASLAAGLGALADAEAVVVTLGDQPYLSPDAVRRVLDARGDGAQAVRATYGGAPGHPVVLERELFPRLRDVAGDVGGRNVMRSAGAREVSCDGLGRAVDVDTPEELATLRSEGARR